MNQKDNIYNRLITELLVSSAASSSSVSAGVANIEITPPDGLTKSVAGGITPPFSFAGAVFTSTVNNIPSGYSIQANSHVLSSTIASFATTSGSSATNTGTGGIILSAVGDTVQVDSTVTLIHSTNPSIILIQSYIIEAVVPAYVGVKAAGFYTVGSLTAIPSDSVDFTLTTSPFGRLYIVLPISLPALKSITDNNGLIIPISEFSFATFSGDPYKYYFTNYDTQFTGTNEKTFKFNFD
jgi:hypothetical protein